MTIMVVGKQHLEGISKKSGKPFNFYSIHYTAPARGVIGEAALTLTLDPNHYDFNSIVVPGEYDVEFDRSGYVVGFLPAV